ncbi:MobA/MobL family protein [uncultured Nitratireductor sp.]|uniref:MobA/MobL family protein n=1 Tax=uncultured Nitratireductor sp. TaxID=520953 RepID=UPI0025FC0A39|nr:MobA/MobL family protein [uncultured Nitratireductor sp.]
MTSSLPPDVALYHMDAKVFQRSKGRSSVAAAAYRSASRLTDERIGETFDYTKKHCVDAFILTPADAPGWARDRESLWNACEAVERANGVVGREVEISIPRDIPEDQWHAFAEEICARYVEAGAVVDVAIHSPTAADKNPNPHLHIMMTTRALDASRPHGFAAKKNDALTQIFESGGRHGGGKRGDALKAERERLANIANSFLGRAGSSRRCTHKSWADLGIDRVAEPDMGEQRIKKMRRQGKHDRRTRLVSSMRAARIQENLLRQTEEEIMAKNPSRQARGGIRPKNQQDFKRKLLLRRIPEAHGIDQDKLHMIDMTRPRVTKIQTRDGGWVELDHGNRALKTYGARGYADEVAQAIYDADYADDIERLEELKSMQRKGSGMRQRRKRDEVPQLPADKVESLADRWRSRGYHKVTEATDGVWIEIGRCKIQDVGDELRIHGPAASDAAVRAMVEKAAAEWAGEVEIFGDKAFKDAAWLEAQRQGVTVYDQATGELYEPSEEIRKRYEADARRMRGEDLEMEEIKRRKAISALLLEAAGGNVAAVTKLRANDADLADFITLHLDDEQRGRLVGKPEADVVAALPEFRNFGKAAREADEAKKREQIPTHAEDFDPNNELAEQALPPLEGAGDLGSDEPDDWSYGPEAYDPEEPEYAARIEEQRWIAEEAERERLGL